MAFKGLWLEGGMGNAMLGKVVFEPLRNLWPMSEVVNDHMCR